MDKNAYRGPVIIHIPSDIHSPFIGTVYEPHLNPSCHPHRSGNGVFGSILKLESTLNVIINAFVALVKVALPDTASIANVTPPGRAGLKDGLVVLKGA